MSKPDSRVVGYIQPGALAALDLCRNDDHNGCAEVWIRPVSDESIALVHESLLAEAESRIVVLQSRLDAVVAAVAKHRDTFPDEALPSELELWESIAALGCATAGEGGK